MHGADVGPDPQVDLLDAGDLVDDAFGWRRGLALVDHGDHAAQVEAGVGDLLLHRDEGVAERLQVLVDHGRVGHDVADDRLHGGLRAGILHVPGDLLQVADQATRDLEGLLADLLAHGFGLVDGRGQAALQPERLFITVFQVPGQAGLRLGGDRAEQGRLGGEGRGGDGRSREGNRGESSLQIGSLHDVEISVDQLMFPCSRTRARIVATHYYPKFGS